MNNYKFLSVLSFLLVTIGLIFSAVPFFEFLKPSVTADEKLLHIDVSELQEGEFLFQNAPSNPMGYIGRYVEVSYLIIRNYDSKLYVYIIPLDDGEVVLPDAHWWRAHFKCSAFGPDVERGSIKKDGVIRCHDIMGADYKWWKSTWKWDYSGRNLSSQSDDMIVPKHKVEKKYGREYVIIGKV